jgi:small multidrug resistance family-3 protein
VRFLKGGFALKTALFLVLAAALEVGGDALMRLGVKNARPVGFILGAITLFLYGLVVNLPDWNFGKLLGVYIAVFYVVSQVVSVAAFHEKLKAPALAGGALIISGGLILALWRAS